MKMVSFCGYQGDVNGCWGVCWGVLWVLSESEKCWVL